VEPIASRGLRRTRATARQRDVSESEPSIVSEPEFLRKTHLTGAVTVDTEIPQRRYLYLYPLCK
jgi:hypothetical protein